MVKQTIEIDVPDGWEAVGFRQVLHGEWYLGCVPGQGPFQWPGPGKSDLEYVVVRRVHAWPEWLMQLARIHGPWFVIDPNGDAYLCNADPIDRVCTWKWTGLSLRLPREWVGYAPPHDLAGDGWRTCKWRLPV